ncbi:MAG: hypothetical protein AABW67_00835 [Nanoarchaeota archaeon]
MNFTNWIKNLEKRKIISRKPHPIIPFILSFIALTLSIIVPSNLKRFIYIITIFSFVFSIIHLIIVRILEKTKR